MARLCQSNSCVDYNLHLLITDWEAVVNELPTPEKASSQTVRNELHSNGKSAVKQRGRGSFTYGGMGMYSDNLELDADVNGPESSCSPSDHCTFPMRRQAFNRCELCARLHSFGIVRLSGDSVWAVERIDVVLTYWCWNYVSSGSFIRSACLC